jgi:hypothetical protein
MQSCSVSLPLGNLFIAGAKARHQTAFLSQKMAQKDPEKKMLLTAENASMHLAKLAAVELHHLRAHFAFRCIHEMVLIAHRR